MKLNAERIVGSSLSIIKYVSQCYDGTSLQSACMVVSGKDFSSYSGEERRNQFCTAYGEFGLKVANICVSGRSVVLCRFLCPVLLTEASWTVFLICSPRFVDTFNMRENYFDISLSVILTLINIADPVLFGGWVHDRKSCWKSSIIIPASLPNVLSCSEKRLVFSDPDTQFPTVGDAARKTLGRRPATKLYCRKTQHILSSTVYSVTKNLPVSWMQSRS